MKPHTQTFLALAALYATVSGAPEPQVTAIIAPKASPPAGCVNSKPGNFEISVAGLSKRELEPEPERVNLRVTLKSGVMVDGLGRTGYIADNYQYQFDAPAQHGAIYTAGFSFCPNGTIALGASTVFWQCLSGNFYNLYDRWWAAQCKPIHLIYHDVSSPSSKAPSGSLGADSSSLAASPTLGLSNVGFAASSLSASATSSFGGSIATSNATAALSTPLSNSTITSASISAKSTGSGKSSSTSSSGKSSGNGAHPTANGLPGAFALAAAGLLALV